MKNSKYFWLFLMMIVATSQLSAQQFFYVYQHDGTINTFLTNEIDSITVSNIGIDGMEYDHYLTQLYWTQDSVYQIPIESIDSVGFVTPQTVLQPNVIDLADALYPYIISCDSLTFYLRNNTPHDILPKEGDKVVYTEMTDIFPHAFAGEIVSLRQNIDGITIVECTLADLMEIFKCYYSTSIQTYPGEVKINRRVQDANTITKDLGSTSNTFPLLPSVGISYQKPTKGGGILELGGNANIDITLKSKNTATYTLIVREGNPISVNAKMTSRIDLSEHVGLAGYLKWDKDFALTVPLAPIAFPFAEIYVSVGPYLKAEAEISSETIFEQGFTLNIEANMNNHGGLTSTPRFYLSDFSHSEKAKVTLNGSLGIGAYGEFGICLVDRNLAKTCIRANEYFELHGDCVLYNDDINNATEETKLYERLKASTISVNVVSELKITGDILELPKWNWEWNIIPPQRLPIVQWDVVPSFEEAYQENSQNTNVIYINANQINSSNGFMLPVTLDMCIVDENDNLVQKCNDNDRYQGGTGVFFYKFYNLSNDKKYKAYPLVTFLGIQMRANPAIDVDYCPAEITKIECTDAEYNEGSNFPNRFYVDVTANLEKQDGIEEWGIYYISNNGRYNTFPFENISNSITESMWYLNDGSTIRFDYSSFVAECDDHVGVYVKKHNEKTGKQRIIYGSLFDYTLRYDTKPSLTFSNPQITNTEIIETSTDNDGNVKYHYETCIIVESKIEGRFWIENITNEISSVSGTWQWGYYEWEPADHNNNSYDIITPQYWDSSNLAATCWYVIHLRNTAQTINSNYLNWSGDQIITNVWTSSTPAFVPKRAMSKFCNNEPRNYVEARNPEEKSRPIEKPLKKIIPCNGGFIGSFLDL